MSHARILSTEDEGAHWRIRRTAAGPLVYAWARARTAIFLDAGGRLWLSRDGGFALEELGRAGSRVLESDGSLIVLGPGLPGRRLDAAGGLHGL